MGVKGGAACRALPLRHPGVKGDSSYLRSSQGRWPQLPHTPALGPSGGLWLGELSLEHGALLPELLTLCSEV